MDINSVLNEEPTQGPRQPPLPTPHLQRGPPISRSTSDDYGPPNAQQHFPRPSLSGHAPQPPTLDTRSATFSNPVPANAHQYTPVRTPQAHQHQHSTQYPFQSQFQSPVQAHHRSVEKYPSLTPTGRPSSRSYSQSQDQRSPLLFTAPQPPPPPSHAHAHTSATPPSVLHSPYAARGSPGSAHTLQQNPYGAAPHHSQPNTPLGPPQAAQRPPVTTPREVISPHAPHQRTYSTASGSGPRSIASMSPGPAVSNINSLLDSTPGYGPAINQPRTRSTEFLQQAERHRSNSISPKSQINRRHESTDSRRESHEQWSARSSLNQGSYEQQPLPGHHHHAPSSLSRSSTGHLSQGAPSPLSQAHQIPTHQRQFSIVTDVDTLTRPSVVDEAQPPPLTQPPKRPSEDMPHTFTRETGKESLLQQPVSRAMMGAQSQSSESSSQVSTPLKRRAETMSQPEPKKPRTQHREPPVWARLHQSNPGYQDQVRKYPQLKDLPLHDPRTVSIRPHQSQAPHRAAQPAGITAAAQPNGVTPTGPGGEFASRKAETSRKLGIPWELSITDKEVQNPLAIAIGNFLYWQFAQRPELLGNDPRNGNLEIEAKIGTLLFNEGNSLRRLDLPVQTPTVLTEDFSRHKIRFESMMDEAQNKSLNEHLNNLLKASMGILDVPGVQSRDRIPLIYQHRYERDTFAPLSDYGLSQLSDFARAALVSSRRDAAPRLRTTYDNNPKLAGGGGPRPCLAQLVKIRLADLDVFCPTDPFDVRISVNIEVDFRAIPGVDLGRLVDPAAAAVEEQAGRKRDNPDRLKDRISYRHCLYQIDLTQVVTDGGNAGPGAAAAEKKHELEVEVDGVALGRQVEALRQGRESAFGEVVEGLVNNVLLLARHK